MPATPGTFNQLKAVGQKAGLSLIALAFRWLLAQPTVDSVILGASRMEHLKENIKACQGPPLAQDILQECDAVWRELRGVTPNYNR